MTGRGLGVALSGHSRPWDVTLELAVRADVCGFEVAFVDGDEARIAGRPEARLYDGLMLASATLHATQRIRVASIRLPGFAHVAHVARALATLQLTGGGRAVGFFGIGSGRHVESLGLPRWSAGERIEALDETLGLVRALWRGTPVTARGRYTHLEEITAPRPAPPVPLVVAAGRPRALALAARHADAWDANVPPLRRYLDPLRKRLERPIETWLWILARPDSSEEEAIRAYRTHWPWFPALAADEYPDAILFGDPAHWPERARALRRELDVDMLVLDLIGLEPAQAHRALEAFRPA